MSTQSTVRDILSQKNSSLVHSISPDDWVFDAIGLMGSHNVGALLVMTGATILGIITERDYARKIVLQNRSSKSTKISEIMETKVIYVVPDDKVSSVLSLMTEERVRHLPVMENRKLLGLISMGDVVKAVMDDQKFMISQLTQYITGEFLPDDNHVPGDRNYEVRTLM